MSDTVTITAQDGTAATLSLRGAEPVSWVVAGREYLWSGNPAHWNRHAPWLFPVVGASAGGRIRVGDETYPMAQHGFARDRSFSVVAQERDAMTLRLVDDAESRAQYPFAFVLDITARVGPGRLVLSIAVTNPGDTALPYALGFHPAFPWPFAGGERGAGGGYHVAFEHAERAAAPQVGEGGLLLRAEQPIPFDGDVLPLDPEMFTEALVVLNARSRWMRFVGPDGSAIRIEAADFPHFAVWTKPTAPFLSLECWTGYADWAGFAGDIARRDSQRSLAAGAQAHHGVTLSIEGPQP